MGKWHMSFYDRKRMTDWLNDPKKVKGCSRKQVGYIRDLKGLLPELARIGTLTYFLTVRLNVTDARSMMWSAGKQKRLILSLLHELKVYKVNPEDEEVFEYDIESIRKRVAYVYRICQENLRLTQHYPYFQAVGFDKLTNFETAYAGDDGETVLDVILSEMYAWEAKHPEEIKAHMESVEKEIRIRDAHREKVKAAEKAEKEAKKAQRKAETAEIREMRENARKEEIRKRKLDKELETTLRHVGGWE